MTLEKMSCWSRFSPERLEKAEMKLIEYSGLQFDRSHIEISTGIFLYCLTCGNHSLPPLILLHGYCGAGLIFYKIVQALSEKYFIYLVDHVGMGRSSRPSFRAQSTYETESFFIEGLEAFRIAVGLERFVLAGHSFGGYISGCYAIKYRQHVEKLLLLSPAGVAERPIEGRTEKKMWRESWIDKFLLFFWLQQICLIEIMRKAGPASGGIIKGYMKGRYGLPEEEVEAIENYLEQVNLLPGSGESGIHYILDFELWPYSPLSKRLADIGIPIAFFYGDRDWMVSDGGFKTKEMSDSPVLVYIITNSDHNMYWDNPKELQEKMLEALEIMNNAQSHID